MALHLRLSNRVALVLALACLFVPRPASAQFDAATVLGTRQPTRPAPSCPARR